MTIATILILAGIAFGALFAAFLRSSTWATARWGSTRCRAP